MSMNESKDSLEQKKLHSETSRDPCGICKAARLRIGLNFTNLFNVDYFETSRSRLQVYPGERFTVQGTISWQF